MRRGNLLVLLVAIVMGGIAAFLARNWVMAQANVAPAPVGTIVVAAAPLAFGTTLTRENLREVPWPAERLPDGAFTSKEDLLKAGRRALLARVARDEPILKRKQSGSLKQFLIAFTVSYLIGYLVNLMLIWRVFAAQELAARLGSVLIPAILVVLSSAVMWLLLTVFAIALAQQPKIRRVLMREISDYSSNAEAQAFAEEAARTASTAPDAVDASARKPSR